jgi:HNH endonuclease
MKNFEEIRKKILEQCVEEPSRYTDTPCLIWTGPKTAGYGCFYDRAGLNLVHRLAYECWVGPIPKGMCVLHICNVRDCCQPEHLKLGTRQDNMDDMVRDGRSCVGVAHWSSKLSTKEVEQVLRLVGERRSFSSIARKFDVNEWVISGIAHGRTYKDIPGVRRPPVSRPTNRFLGAIYNKRDDIWSACLQLNGKGRYFGRFCFEVDAACAVNAHIAYLGLDKPLNIIPEGEWCHD